MNARILVLVSALVILGIGVLIGYVLFRDASSDELVIGEKPAQEDLRTPGAPEDGSDTPDESKSSLLSHLRAENSKLVEEIKSLKSDLENADKSRKQTPGEISHPAVPDRQRPTTPEIDRPSILNPADLEEGKGGIEGYFINIDGSPAKGIPVSLVRRTGQLKGLNTRTDLTGHYKILNLTPGQYHISSEIGPETTCKWPKRSVQIVGGKIARVDFGSTENITVRGRALNSAKEPIMNATLLLYHYQRIDGEFLHYSVQTDEKGCYKFENLKPLEYDWTLRGHDGHGGFGKIRFSKEGPFEWNIEQKSAEISGVVIDRDSGSPIPRASIMAGVGGSPGLLVRSDSNGHFRFAGLSAGTYIILVSCDRFVMKIPDPVKLVEGQSVEGIRIILHPAAVFKAKVMDGNGKAIMDVDVELTSINEKGKEKDWPLYFKANGIAEVNTIPPGKYHLEVSAEGYRTERKPDILLSEGDNPMLEFSLIKK